MLAIQPSKKAARSCCSASLQTSSNLKSPFSSAFQRLQRDLHNKLWGGSTEYNYIFKNLSRLFLAKIYDELTTKPGKPYRFQVQQHVDPKSKKATNETPQQIFERIKDLVKDSTSLLGYSALDRQKYGIEEDYIDANKVAYVVNQAQGISVIENVHAKTGDILGDFFEGIIAEGFKQDRGTFFTHKNIVYFLLYGLCVDDLVTRLATDPVDPRSPVYVRSCLWIRHLLNRGHAIHNASSTRQEGPDAARKAGTQLLVYGRGSERMGRKIHLRNR